MIRGNRVTVYMLPSASTLCRIAVNCPYRDTHGLCDEPRINKQNSDSACFKLNNKDVLSALRDRDPD